MKQRKNRKLSIWMLVICGLFLIIFYLRQQYLIVKMQYRINQIYEAIQIQENENKKLILNLQKLTDTNRLSNLAKRLNFTPPTEKDIIVVE